MTPECLKESAGWAKARMRRAHHLSTTKKAMVGALRLAHLHNECTTPGRQRRSVVVEAVICEPVSVREFPAIREFTGKIRDIRVARRRAEAITSKKSEG
jgi:hypothetical protein